MSWPTDYACAPGLLASNDAFSLRPIRWEDREPIRQWRNAQIDVLRQPHPLSIEDQDRYFADVVQPQFAMPHPPQVLLGMTEDDVLVGYGGVVHLAWPDRRGEVSFLTPPDRAQGRRFQDDWSAYLTMLIPLCRGQLGLHKLTTETYEFRTDVIGYLEDFGFRREGELVEHHLIGERWVTSLAHGLILR